MNNALEPVLATCAANRERDLNDLFTVVRQPSISAQNVGIREMADLLMGILEAASGRTRLLETSVHPLVYAEFDGPAGAPTVLFYGHYDVQPVVPLELWQTPPFKPDIRDGRVYARGSGDMKANLINVIHAVETFARTAGQPPVNLMFLFEGEEEIGSPNLPRYVEDQKHRLAADVVINADGGVGGPDLPSLSVGLKGLGGCQIDIRTAASDLHSGFYGAAVASATQVAIQLAATFHDDEGRVAVEGFYDKVVPLTEQDRIDIANATENKTDVLVESRAFSLWGEPGYGEFERIFARPTLDINGMWGGFTGEGGKTVTPAEAHIKVTCRLVPDQDPLEIVKLIEAHVAKHITPGTKFVVKPNEGLAYPFRVRQDLPALQKAAQALEEMYGREPIYTRSGGSVPLTAVFQRVLGADTVSYAFALAGSGAHAPNEWFRVEDLAKGRIGNCRLFELLGEE